MTEYLSTKSLIIAATLTVAIGLGSVGWYLQTSDADIEPESKAEMYNFIKDTYVTQKQLNTIIAGLDLRFAEVTPPDNFFKEMNRNFTSIAKVLDNHNTQLIVLRAANQISIPGVSQGTGDFDLKTINIQTFTITQTFPQNMPVYITGSYDGTSTKIDYDIYKSGILYATGNPSITAGTFTFAFNANGDAELGEYSVTVIIDNRKDTISFEIE